MCCSVQHCQKKILDDAVPSCRKVTRINGGGRREKECQVTVGGGSVHPTRRALSSFEKIQPVRTEFIPKGMGNGGYDDRVRNFREGKIWRGTYRAIPFQVELAIARNMREKEQGNCKSWICHQLRVGKKARVERRKETQGSKKIKGRTAAGPGTALRLY